MTLKTMRCVSRGKAKHGLPNKIQTKSSSSLLPTTHNSTSKIKEAKEQPKQRIQENQEVNLQEELNLS